MIYIWGTEGGKIGTTGLKTENLCGRLRTGSWKRQGGRTSHRGLEGYQRTKSSKSRVRHSGEVSLKGICEIPFVRRRRWLFVSKSKGKIKKRCSELNTI